MSGDHEHILETPDSEDGYEEAEVASNVGTAARKRKSKFRLGIPKVLKGGSGKSHHGGKESAKELAAAAKQAAEANDFEDLNNQLEQANDQLRILINEVDQWERKFDTEVSNREALIAERVAEKLSKSAADSGSAAELESVKKELAIAQESLNRKIADSQQEASASLRKSQDECVSLKRRIEEVEELNKSLQSRLTAFEESQVADTRSSEELRSLQTELQNFQRKHSELLGKESELNAANANLVSTNEQLNAKVAEMTKTQNSLNQQLEEQQRITESLKEKSKKYDQNLTAQEGDVERLTIENNEMAQKLKKLQQQQEASARDTSDIIQSLQLENQKLTEQVAAAKSELRSKTDAEARGIDDLKAKVKLLIDQNEAVEHEKTKLLAERQGLMADLEKAQNLADSACTQAQEERAEARRVQDRLQQLEIENRSLLEASGRNGDAEVLRTRNVQVECELAALQSDHDELKKAAALAETRARENEQSLKNRIAETQAQLEQANAALKLSKNEIHNLNDTLQDKAKELKELLTSADEEISNRDEQIDKLRKSLDQLSGDQAAAKKDISQFTEALEVLTREKTELLAKVKRMQAERQREAESASEMCASLQDRLNKTEQNLRQMGSEHELQTKNATRKLEEALRKVEQSAKREKDLSEQLASLKKQGELSMSELAKDAEDKLAQLRKANSEIESLRSSQADLNKQITDLRAEVAKLTQTNEETASNRDALAAQIVSLSEKEKDAHSQRTHSDSQWKKKLADAEARLESAVKKGDAREAELKKEVAKLEQTVKTLTDDLNECRVSLASVTEELRLARLEIMAASTSLEKTTAMKKSELADHIEKSNRELENLRKAHASSERLRNEEVERLREQNEKLDAELAKLLARSKADSTALTAQKSEIVELTIKTNDLEAMTVELTRREARHERENHDLRQTEVELRESLQKAKQRIDQLTREAEQVPRLQDALTEQANICDSLRDDLNESAERLKDFDSLNAALLKREEDLMKDLAQLTDSNAELLSKLNVLRSQTAGQSNTTAELNEALSDLEQQHASLKKRKQELIVENGNLQDRLHTLETEAARLRDRADRFGEENRELKDQLMKSEVQLRTHRASPTVVADNGSSEAAESLAGVEHLTELRQKNMELEMEVRALLESLRKMEDEAETLRGRIVDLEVASKTNPPAVVYSNVIANVGHDQCALVTTPDGPHEVVWCLKDRLIESLFETSSSLPRPTVSTPFLQGVVSTSHNVFDPSHPQLSLKAIDDRPEVSRVLSRVRSLWKLGEDLRLALVQGDPFLATAYQDTTTPHADWNSTLSTLRGSAEAISKRNAELERLALEYSNGIRDARQIAKNDRERAKNIITSLKTKLESVQESKQKLQTERDHLLNELKSMESQVQLLTAKAIGTSHQHQLPAAGNVVIAAPPILR